MDNRMSNYQMLTLLKETKRVFAGANYMNRQQRFDAVISLAEWGVFSVGQLSQITGMSTSAIHAMNLEKKGGAGRFNPMSIDTMIQLLLNRINKQPLNLVLLDAAIRDGNSHRIIYKLTGIQPSTISRKINGNSNPGVQ